MTCPPSTPDHCTSTFKYFLAVAKILKLSQEFICATTVAFIEDSVTAKKCRQTIKQEKKLQRKEKDDYPLAIGENYINKMFLFS